MNLSLRAKLRLSESCSNEELQDACNRYYAIYRGVMDSSATEAVKAVAGSKLEDLVDHARREGVELKDFDGVDFATGGVNINATVEQMLAGYNGSLSPERAAALEKAIGALPHSAKRYYLSALVVLGKGKGTVDSFHEAVTKLKSAASEDPQNIVYPALIQSLVQEIESYATALRDWKAQEEAKAAAAARREKFKEVMSTIGTILVWVFGAVLTIAGGLLSCFCSICEGC